MRVIEPALAPLALAAREWEGGGAAAGPWRRGS